MQMKKYFESFLFTQLKEFFKILMQIIVMYNLTPTINHIVIVNKDLKKISCYFPHYLTG